MKYKARNENRIFFTNYLCCQTASEGALEDTETAPFPFSWSDSANIILNSKGKEWDFACVCVCVCECVCMYVCVLVSVRMNVRMYVRVIVYVYVRIHASTHVYACVCACMRDSVYKIFYIWLQIITCIDLIQYILKHDNNIKSLYQ